MAFELSEQLGYCQKGAAKRVEKHFKSVGLPTRIKDMTTKTIPTADRAAEKHGPGQEGQGRQAGVHHGPRYWRKLISMPMCPHGCPRQLSCQSVLSKNHDKISIQIAGFLRCGLSALLGILVLPSMRAFFDLQTTGNLFLRTSSRLWIISRPSFSGSAVRPDVVCNQHPEHEHLRH